MMSSIRLGGAAALCTVILLSACVKKTDQTTTMTDASSATIAPAAASGTNASNSRRYITLPVYPGAAVSKVGSMSMATNRISFDVKVYTTKDSAKKVAEWYQAHLPASFKGAILSAGPKAVGTFVDMHADGTQAVVVANQPDGATRIQLSTKHEK